MNRQISIKTLPKGDLTEDAFELQQGEMPEPGDGQVLVRTLIMSIDAANRAWMQGATYREPVLAGDLMHTYALGEVVASNAPGFAPGDLVSGESRWAEYVAVDADKLEKRTNPGEASNLLSVFGIAGLTAYHGLRWVGAPQPGDTVVVSAAAGSVGIYVGQIAKALGCRAVGIAGGDEKCAWVRETLGFDDCINYRDPAWMKALKAACPDGIDIYFDNVGGQILEAVLFQMNLKGRVVCCGAVSQYNASAPVGPRNLPGLVVVKRLRMEGFIAMDFPDKDAEAQADLSRWVADGQIKVIEDIVEGLENAPRALIGLLAGDNRGKRLVRVAG
ncbi:MAG: NADP-dependent oxidoreductase [Pseudomonadota bacterium]